MWDLNLCECMVLSWSYFVTTSYVKHLYILLILIAHHDQQALQERLDGVRRELEEEQGALDRLRREATTRAEQDRGNINQLRDELARFKTRLEESRLVLIST